MAVWLLPVPGPPIKKDILGRFDKLASVQLPHRRFVDLTQCEVEARQVLVCKEAGDLRVVGDRPHLAFGDLGLAELLADINARTMRRVCRSRQDLFVEIEHAALRPLPDTPFEYAEWKQDKVHPDYHIEVLHSFYSVPHNLIGRKVDVRLTLLISAEK